MNLPPKNIREYLESRGISPRVQEVNQLGWDSRIVIPIFDFSGKRIFNKYRRAPWVTEGPKYQYDKGSKSALYGIHKLDGAYEVIICEGELDALALESRGFVAVCSTGGAGTFMPHWGAWLVDKDVYVCYDNDRAGADGREVVQRVLPNAKQVYLTVGKDCTDYFLEGHTSDEFRQLMAEAKPMELKPLPEPVHVSRPMPQGQTSDRIIKAKQVPIESILKFNNQKFARCPLHADKTPSLHLYANDKRWKCFSCGKGGDVIDLVSLMNQITIGEAIDKLNT